MGINLYSLLVRGGLSEQIIAIPLPERSSVNVRYFVGYNLGDTESIDLRELMQECLELRKEVEYERNARHIAEDALIKLCGIQEPS